MKLEEVMRTTFAAREFLDEEIPDEAIERILDNARFAPSGGNQQPWKVIAVRDQATRDAFLEWMKPTFYSYVAQTLKGVKPFNPIEPCPVSAEELAAVEGNDDFIRQLCSAPLILLVLVDLSKVTALDTHLDRINLIAGGSIYPFAWNILLAARNEGYGGTMTTFLCAAEPQVKELLDIPDNYALCTMIPLGKPVKQLTRLKRNPVNHFLMQERWQET